MMNIIKKITRRNKTIRKMYEITTLNLKTGEIETSVSDASALTGIAITGMYDIVEMKEVKAE